MQKLLIIAASLLVAFVVADEAPVADEAVGAPKPPSRRPTPEQIAARDAEMKAKCIAKLGEEKCQLKFAKMEEIRSRPRKRKQHPLNPEGTERPQRPERPQRAERGAMNAQQKLQRSNPHRPRAINGRRPRVSRDVPPTESQ